MSEQEGSAFAGRPAVDDAMLTRLGDYLAVVRARRIALVVHDPGERAAAIDIPALLRVQASAQPRILAGGLDGDGLREIPEFLDRVRRALAIEKLIALDGDGVAFLIDPSQLQS